MPTFIGRYGFTLAELPIVIAIIAILAAILFPSFSRVREKARRSSCQSNLKQIGLGVFQYAQDYDEKYPNFTSSHVALPANGALVASPAADMVFWQSNRVFSEKRVEILIVSGIWERRCFLTAETRRRKGT